jgi:predicted DCC family thiol-disulfide oxidoreductase YuxK
MRPFAGVVLGRPLAGIVVDERTSHAGLAADAPVLLYDGDCGFCSASVKFILTHERRHFLRFAPLQCAFAAMVRARHKALEHVDSIIWVEPRDAGFSVWTRSAAALRVDRYLGGPWRLLAIAYLIPRGLRDRAYDVIARHRRRVIPAICWVPPATSRGRFLD